MTTLTARCLVVVGVLAGLTSSPAWSTPRIEFSAPTLEIAEDDDTPFVALRLVDCATRTPNGSVEVSLVADSGSATEGIDFFAYGRAAIGMQPGQDGRVFRSAEIPIAIVHDGIDEPSEQFALRIELAPDSVIDCGDGPGPPDLGPPLDVRIRDVPLDLSVVSFVASEVHVTETDAPEIREARVAVTRAGGRMPVNVLCQTTRAGSAVESDDFEPVASVLGWGEDEQGEKWCVVPVLGDDRAERPETITLSLIPLEGRLEIGASSATVFVNDDDSPGRVQFTAVRFDAREDEGVAVIELERRWGSEGTSTVRVVATPRGAHPGEDYDSLVNEVSWASGEEGPRTVEIALVDDDRAEGEESIVLRLESAGVESLLGDLKNAVVVIADDDGVGTSNGSVGAGPMR